ncbi:hypothetical protein P700755_002967 [Psychroflexus torquis ATCC 700755]|uniref:DUF4062 domain-containing protein n=2 Tax=Psychroflexus TaxID=83612 RepID=K4IIL9_PSYTT|nr:hypothetical protein P700755_002967 [Psychroflexus torquis ATCC 700755]
MAKKQKIKLMVASTVYQNRDLLLQICGILNTYGYHVINSEFGTLHPPLGMNNTDACLAAVEECDVFFGIINPMYSTGITHQEFLRAIAINKPRRYIAHSFVTFSRKLLAQYMYADAANTQRNDFEIQTTSVMDSVRVIDMYNDAVQIDLPYEERKHHWVQEFFRPDEAMRHIETLFRDIKRVERELANLNNLDQ